MCTMTIPASVCKRKPMKIVRDKALAGLPEFIRAQCATRNGARTYLASVGLKRSRRGELTVVPM